MVENESVVIVDGKSLNEFLDSIIVALVDVSSVSNDFIN
jgi:hypothetical protein